MKKVNKRIRQIISLAIALLILLPMSTYADSYKSSAKPASSKVLVNNEQIYFEAYNIEGNNYFKLRDIAKVVSNTEKQFEVDWNEEDRVISIIPGKGYTPVGGELKLGDGEEKIGRLNTSPIYINGKEVRLTAYTIKDNNYFKLRDIGQAFDIGIIWDSKTNIVEIDTSIGYITEEELKQKELMEMEGEVVRLVNIEREKAGLAALKTSIEVSNVARIKSEDMAKNNYFNHNSPTYGSPFEMMDYYGVIYNAAGENIAMGHPTAKLVVEGWMNSPGHRANILESMFKKIGVGLYQTENGTNYWTQMFTD